MNQRIRYRWSPVVLVFVSLLVGCGKPFNVQPRPKVLPANYKVSAESGGITIEAEPVTDEDKLYDTFEANLLLASVLPIRLRLTNTQAEGL